ncbi:MAG TPA: class I SAM-dependent methyltransferase [Polyangiaceae bacterium]|nr:class I SAM-dependent methyltransferase [Polyangiaceae bacterium]
MAGSPSLAAQFYDLDKPEAPPEVLEFYRRAAQRSRGPILEPMCGSGRYLLPLQAEGFDIDGIDSSPAMLDACRRQARKLKLEPRLFHQDITALQLPRRYGLAFIPAGSFCLLIDPQRVRAALRELRHALLPGGELLIEIERAVDRRPTISSAWEGRWLELEDGSKIILSYLTRYSGVEQTEYSLRRYEHVHAGQLLRQEYEDFAVRFWEPESFRAHLQEMGFSQIEAFKPYTEEALQDDDEAILFRAVRARD